MWASVLCVLNLISVLMHHHHHHHHHHKYFLKWPKQQRHREDHYRVSTGAVSHTTAGLDYQLITTISCRKHGTFHHYWTTY